MNRRINGGVRGFRAGRAVLVGVARLILLAAGASPGLAAEILEVVDIAPVWSGHPVDFCLLTRAPHQFAGYYDAERRMTVVSRELDETNWIFVTLPESVDWDSHNGIVMAIDDLGFLHLAGNMHVSPLKYFRTSKPLDITAFERVGAMVGAREDRVTYPEFLHGVSGELIFTYRDGKSGDGAQIFNVYDSAARTWRRLLDEPLADGEGQRNAYFVGPARGPDGWFHLCWVWRDTPDCATNHDVCYARSKDLVHWETGRGEPYKLPITLATSDIVDPVPVNGGLLNGCTKIGFDAEGRPVITYHKFDENGITQLYNARLEGRAWVVRQGSHWSYRWEFSGNGSIAVEIHLKPVKVAADGALTQSWNHKVHGKQRWRLDPATLAPVERLDPEPSPIPANLREVTAEFPGMTVQFQMDAGQPPEDSSFYLLRWETLGPNRDRPREQPWPAPSWLRVYRIR